MLENEQWAGFEGRIWKEEINVRDFIQKNYKPYDGDESFLADPTDATNKLWGRLQELQKEERAKGGVLDMETEVVAGLTAYGPGYIDESAEQGKTDVILKTLVDNGQEKSDRYVELLDKRSRMVDVLNRIPAGCGQEMKEYEMQ